MATGGVYNQSSAAYGKALNATQSVYNQYGKLGAVNPSTISSGMGAYTKKLDPATIASGIGAYKNPYEQQVVKSAQSDIMTIAQQQQEQNAAAASAAGAFGGSRHGLVEAETNKAAQKNLADMTANLKLQGYNTAAGLASQDVANEQQAKFQAAALSGQDVGNDLTAASINNQQAQAKLAGQGSMADLASSLSQQGFDFGQTITGNQAADGNTKQLINQTLLDQASGMFGQYAGQGGTLLDTLSSALTGSPLNNATKTTSSYKPGLLSYLGAGTNAASGGKGGKG